MPKSLQRMGLRAQKAPRPWGPPTGADAGATGSVRNSAKSKFQKNLEKFGREVVRAAYVLLISGLVASCSLLGGAVSLPDVEQLPALGVTECTPQGPIAWVNIDVLGTPDEKGTIEHERVHVQQIRRFANCAEFESWYLANRLQAEAEAFCAEVYDDVRKERRTYQAAIERYGRWLAGYEAGVTQRQGEELLRKVCVQR